MKERFGYVVGQQGVVNVTIDANPQPYFTWIVDSESIHAGSPDLSNRLQTNTPIEAVSEIFGYSKSTVDLI